MITVEQADQVIATRLSTYGITDCPLADAHGQILRETVLADRDLPPYDRVTMDGIALHSSAWLNGVRSFRIESEAPAGRPAQVLRDPQTGCVQVMTGALRPEGSDTIIPVEDLVIDEGTATISANAQVAPLQYLHSQGSDRRASEPVLTEGTRLCSPHISIAAALGRTTLRVTRPPSIAIISTGDELVDVGMPVAPYQIRSSNDHGIRAALYSSGYRTVTQARVHDDLPATMALLKELLAQHEVLILTGGVSMGERDFVPAALEQLGVTRAFHKIKQKPGKPMWFGLDPDNKPVFALPGNTVSTMICLHRYVLPALDRALGAPPSSTVWARLANAIHFRPPLTGFVPVRLTSDDEGRNEVDPIETNTSGDLTALAPSDGFVQLDDGQRLFEAGEVVRYFPWR